MSGPEKIGILISVIAVIAASNVSRFAIGHYTKMNGVANFPKWLERFIGHPRSY
jgi:hypothetical protein